MNYSRGFVISISLKLHKIHQVAAIIIPILQKRKYILDEGLKKKKEKLSQVTQLLSNEMRNVGSQAVESRFLAFIPICFESSYISCL
jgi:hypothetical protein